MPNIVIFRALFFILASLLITSCTSNLKQPSTEKPNVLKQQIPSKKTANIKNKKENTVSNNTKANSIDVSALMQRMLNSNLSPWSSSENAYIVYAGGILTAKFDDNKDQLHVLPDPVPTGQKACLFTSSGTAPNKTVCQKLLSELNQLIP